MGADDRIFWIWMQQIFGAGSSKPWRILSDFSSPKEFYEAGKTEWMLTGILSPRELLRMETYFPEQAAKLADNCKRVGHHIITPQDSDYPSCFRELYNAPCVLYVKGTLPDVDQTPSISIVGTRDATESGKKIAFHFAYSLAKAGSVVVSGGARGIDASAHKGALQASGKTVCILGCGINCRYLMEFETMRHAVENSGAVVSEYPLDTPGYKLNFPIRNRLIAGFSLGTLVIEAAGRSGSLITANLALEQGKDIFAVPCSIDSPVSQGVNNLIKSGAKPVSNAAEILEEYMGRFPDKIKLNRSQNLLWSAPKAKVNLQKNIEILDQNRFSPDAIIIFKNLKRQPCHITELEMLTGLPVSKVLTALTELELSGKIIPYSGRRYSLK